MNRRNWIMAAGLLLALPGMALAAKPGYLHVNESVAINASPAKVWSLVKDWNGLHKWHPAFSNAEIKSGENNKVGAVRTLTMADGGAKFDEELDGFSDKKRKYSYRIISDSPLPVVDYFSTIQVKSSKAKGKGTTVLVWTGKFKRKVADNPPAGQDDASVKKAIIGAYQAGLQNVKKLAETK
jgi:mxaD protein